MPYSQRNIFYLRTSPHVVLQTILYLDPRDLKWMNSNAHHDYEETESDQDRNGGNRYEEDEKSTGDLIWNRALSKLRYKIMPKLKSESIEGDQLSSTNKKEKVDVHIEPDFQMAYFFRKVSGKHAVLLKQKELRFPESGAAAAAASTAQQSRDMMPPPLLPASAMSSHAADSMPASRLSARELNQTNNVLFEGSRISNEESAIQIEVEEDVKPPNNLKRGREDESNGSKDVFSHSVRIKQEEEEDDDDELQILDSMPISVAQEQQSMESIDVDAMQDDKKPHLHVDYSGFRIFGKCFIVVIEPTKRTKRLRSSLFQTVKPVERHQLSATPVPRQYRETPKPRGIQNTPIRQMDSIAPEEGDEDDAAAIRSDSRRHRMSDGLFRGTPSDWTPTPTPEPERREKTLHSISTIAPSSSPITDMDNPDEDNDDDPNNSTSVMLATQMLEGGIAGQGNDIDDE